jgi:hypothetical protein
MTFVGIQRARRVRASRPDGRVTETMRSVRLDKSLSTEVGENNPNRTTRSTL